VSLHLGEIASGIAMFDVNIAILYPSERLKSLPKRSDAGLHLGIMLGKCVQKHDPPHSLRLLRVRRERPRGRAADQRDEIAPSHAPLRSSLTLVVARP
jgi:hypothetical protein